MPVGSERQLASFEGKQRVMVVVKMGEWAFRWVPGGF